MAKSSKKVCSQRSRREKHSHQTSGLFRPGKGPVADGRRDEIAIVHFDLLYLTESFVRLYRTETYPPLGGTLLQLDEQNSILYTKGSVPFYETYPSTYPPKSLRIDSTYAQRPAHDIARECLALTKTNWNNTRFDGQLPITLGAARQVGTILKYVEDTSKISQPYRFYM
jgi:hypothetical protein